MTGELYYNGGGSVSKIERNNEHRRQTNPCYARGVAQTGLSPFILYAAVFNPRPCHLERNERSEWSREISLAFGRSIIGAVWGTTGKQTNG